MRCPFGVRTGTTKTELMQRTYQPKLASRNRPQVIAVQEPSIPKAAQYRRHQADVILPLCNTTPRTSDALRFKASRNARLKETQNLEAATPSGRMSRCRNNPLSCRALQ